MPLPAAPIRLLDDEGRPRFGRFAGQAGPIDWRALAPPFARGRWWRRFHHKRWHYVALCTDRVFCAVAIVDLGWTSTAFAYAFDRTDGAMLADVSRDGLPGLSARLADHAGASSRFRTRRSRIAIDVRADGSHRLALHDDGLDIDAEFGPAPLPLLLAVGPVAQGAVHATQKSSGMPLRGTLRAAGKTYGLDGGVASLDYSNGLLARDTAWRWASAHTLDMGFNLQAGYFGDNENALWLDGALHALGPARFDFDAADPLSPWRVSTDDGLLDLRFTPAGARRGDKNLLVAASRYVQPIGTFSGWVRSAPDGPKRAVTRMAGVTEDHASRW